ncbi:flagellar hook-length control protein FliK [Saccharibacillus alkalitolerans]|uniref:Flagellar hook-length control protein FliK n=1 Tax=Saccharibacillus alkalitolerans TaxID=2705290 RepID=A0ABX0F7N2_9BACL|nr:flagellar hook-length control protein FliK [Saccharibacillus alkalitolerans]NGZ75524.1 flagellar hook-length control protein FliK [Saccharibacillus alkalitolerans]
MNIGSLFKNVMGDAKPGDAKQLELRAGQVVRGVVQSVSEDGKEAVVQIQGVKVNAKLEAPLQAGQTAFMQVQPSAEDGSIVMKPVPAPPGTAAGAQSMEDTLKQIGLPDNKQNRELVRMMQQAEVPLTREQASEVRNLLAQKPASADAQQWVRSIGILQQRGLPVTPQSVAGMQQAVFGPPASVLLQNLEQQVAAALSLLGEAGGEEGAASGRAQANVQGAAFGQGSAASAASGGQAGAGAAVPAGTAAAASGASAGAPAAGAPGGASAPAAADAGESGPQAQARAAAQAAPGAAGGAGNPAVPDAAQQAAGTAKAAGANAAPTVGAAAAQAAQGSAASADPSGRPAAAGGQPAQTAGAAASASSDAALLRKVQALLGELRSAASGSAGTADGNPAAAAGQAAPQAQPGKAEAGPWIGRLFKMLGAEHEQQAARSTLLNAPPTAAPQSAQQAAQAQSGQAAPQARGSQAPLQAQQGAAQAADGTARTESAASAAKAEGQSNVQASARPGTEQALRAVQSELGRSDAVHAESRAAQPAAAEVRETLKSLLLQLSASDSLPAAVKDAAQQAVQQMTGQQLLLNTDRTAPFAQVTMFLPFVGPDGSQTASVQIESRRGPKGELDASNCRLWFDLDMKALGRTVIDVQVVDRKVSLNFRNDEEWARPLLEAGQPQIASALEAAGYQLLALRTDALPQRNAEAAEDKGASLSYTPPSYRGVDMKI